MNRLLGILLLCVLILLVGGGIFYLNQNKPLPGAPTKSFFKKNTDAADAKKAEEMIKELRRSLVTLNAVNKSGEVGIVSLKDLSGKVEVVIEMTGGFPKDTPQPAHIHTGTCPGVGTITYTLKDVVNGKSDTTLNVSMDELFKQPLAINVHKSNSEMSNYVSCGEVGKNAYTSS